MRVITSRISDIPLKIASLINRMNVVGMALPEIILIHTSIPKGEAYEKILFHEAVHIKQWRRYWYIGFPFVYITQFLLMGYNMMDLEREARREIPVDGVCCYCGYSGELETECPKSDDQSHCLHWWEGEEE